MSRKQFIIIGICLSLLIIVLIYVFATPYIAPSIGPNIVRADADGDGLFNDQEMELGTDPTKADTDNDELDDGLEVEIGTSPVDFDTDSDGLGDGQEISIGSDPLDIDSDNDGLEDGFELNSFGTDPIVSDSDQDGLSDKEEQDYGTNPLSQDTDDDGASDYNEIFVRHTDPLISDIGITLTLRDEETNLRIKDVTVYIDGVEVGTTTEQGTLYIDTISIGQHDLSITYVGYGKLDIGYFSLEKNSVSKLIYIDMPTPQLVFSVSVDEWLSGFNEVGKAKITVGNQGNIVSEDTMALVTVYDSEDSKILDQALIRLGSVAVGETSSKESDLLDTSFWHDEYVLVVLFDGSEYLPNRNLESMINAPGSVADDLVWSVSNYLANNPELVGTIIGAAVKVILGA